MTDNKSAFAVNQYDENVRKVIPHYDEIYEQIFSVITTYCGDKPLAVLDTGCGTGNFGVMALNRLNLTELVLCDPSEKMLADAKKKLANQGCEYHCIGSEKLEFSNRFDIVTAIQSHHYFDRATREAAVKNCFNALKPGGIFICFENTAPFTECGKDLLLKRIEAFGLAAGRTPEEVRSHSARYNTEYFPITIKEHLELLDKTGFAACELFWHSYMQSGFYAIKGRKMSNTNIQPIQAAHLERYAEIYAKAFSGEPWNDPWRVEDAAIHISEIMESRHSYGLEYVVNGEVAGFILGASMLFHYGRTFEINDLAVHPDHQRQGIASKLLERLLEDIKQQGIVGVHLITAAEGILPSFYEKFGFQREQRVMLMGMETE